MTPDLILGLFAGAIGVLVLLGLIAAVDWLLQYQAAPDEHRAVTPGIRLEDMEIAP